MQKYCFVTRAVRICHLLTKSLHISKEMYLFIHEKPILLCRLRSSCKCCPKLWLVWVKFQVLVRLNLRVCNQPQVLVPMLILKNFALLCQKQSITLCTPVTIHEELFFSLGDIRYVIAECVGLLANINFLNNLGCVYYMQDIL